MISRTEKIINTGFVFGIHAFYALAGVSVILIAPIVSLVVTPIFLAMTFPHWIIHRYLYRRTLVDKTRENYGRIPGQDYTRWNGRAENRELTTQEKAHLIGENYIHGLENTPRKRDPGCPFQTKEDLDWLNKELERKIVESELNKKINITKAVAKALIPIVGIIWLVAKDILSNEMPNAGCNICKTGWYGPQRCWTWEEAIKFHRDTLDEKLKQDYFSEKMKKIFE